MKDWEKYRVTGFTLAEVLITLGIIGIVAEITIPSLYHDFQEQNYKIAYKKAYSTASQAWLMANTNGNLTLCNAWNGDCNMDNFVAFKKEMKVAKDCGTDNTSCWNQSGQKAWQGGGDMPTASALAFIDSSGMVWSKDCDSPSTSGTTFVDTNGDKLPNQFGKDRFIFYFNYFTMNIPKLGMKSNIPSIGISPDFPNADTTNYPTTQQLYKCPSMNTHPCYYTSWITGGH